MTKLKLILSASALVLGAAAASAEEVRVYNWTDYIDEELLTKFEEETGIKLIYDCLLYTSPSPRDQRGSRMPSSA